MKFHFFEAQQGPVGPNWGRFAVGRWEPEEWAVTVAVEGAIPDWSLLRASIRDAGEVYVMDLRTGEGAFFTPGRLARADLNKRRIWVCVLFEAFLEWLYRQDLSDLERLSKEHRVVNLPHVPAADFRPRHPGPSNPEQM